MFGQDLDPDPAPGVEIDFDPAPLGSQCIDQVVEQQVGEVFVEDPLVPIGPEVKFQGFRFDDLLIGDVTDEDFGEVRLSGFGAKAGEFIGAQLDHVSPFGITVGEGFELSFRASRSFSKFGEVFVFGIFFSDQLNEIRIYGFKLGFWWAHQGSIFTFVLIIYVYSTIMARIDKRFLSKLEKVD